MARYAVEVLIKASGGEKAKAEFAAVGHGAHGAGAEIKHLTEHMLGFELSIKGLGVALLHSFAGFELFHLAKHAITEAVGESIRAQQSFAQLEAGVKSTGGAAGFTAKEIRGIAMELSEMSGQSHDAIEGAQKVLLTFANIKGENFEEASRAVLDLSTRMGNDLQAAALQVGKALNDPIGGMTALKRVGVQFTDSQEALIKKLVESHHGLEAQKVILEELQVEFGGSARAARDTLGGALTALHTAWSDLMEDIGTRHQAVFREWAEGGIHAIETLRKHVDEIVSALRILKEALVAAALAFAGWKLGVLVQGLSGFGEVLALVTARVWALDAALAANPIGAIAVGAGLAYFALKRYAESQRLSYEAELARLARSQDMVNYLQNLHERTQDLTDAERALASERLKNLRLDEEAARATFIRLRDAESAAQARRQQLSGMAVGQIGATHVNPMGSREVQDALASYRELHQHLGQLQVELKRLGMGVGHTTKDFGELGKEGQKALANVAQDILDLERKAQEAGARLRAALRGPEAYRQELLSQKILEAILKEQAKLRDINGRLTDEQIARIRVALTLEDQYTRQLSAVLALQAGHRKTVSDVAQAWAELSDARSQSGAASRELAKQEDVDAFALQHQLSILDPLVESYRMEIDVRYKKLAAIRALTAEQNRENEAQDALRRAQAELSDVVNTSAEAVARLGLAEKQRIAIEKAGVAGNIEAEAHIRAKVAADELELRTTNALTEAEKRRKAAQADLANRRAEFADYKAAATAARVYGSELARILQQEGLLAQATEERRIQEEALAAFIAEKGVRPLEAVTAEIRRQHAEVAALAAEWARFDIEQWIEEPIRQAAQAMESQMLDAIARVVATGKADWKSLWQSFLETAVRAIEEWLVRWIAAQRIAQAEAARTAALQAAGSTGTGAGTAYSSLFSMGGQVAAGHGSGSGSGGLFYSSGSGLTAAGYMAIFVAALAVFRNYMATKGTPKVTGEVVLGGPGGISTGDILGNKGTTGAMKQMHAAVDKLVLAVKDFIRSLGGEIEATFAEASMYITKKGRGKKTHWWVQTVDGLARDFGRDQEAAIQYALVQAIKATPTTGLSPEVSAAIRNSVAETLDALQSDIAAAMQALHARLGDAGSRVYDVWRQYDAELKKLQELGIATGAVVDARNREIDAMRNQLLGINTSTADFLASLASFQRGIEEATKTEQDRLNAQIAAAQARIAAGPEAIGEDGRRRPMSADQWAAEVARLQGEIDQYLAQLQRIPRALSDQEISMAIFDSLYKYLEGDKKYAEQAHKYALLKVELEFAAIKAQLVALGKWEEFAGMFDDALAAARAQAGKPPRAGGGSGRQDARQGALDQLAEMRARAQGDVAVTLQQWAIATRDWNQQAKEAKLTAAQRAEGERLLREEMQRTLRVKAEELAGVGTDFTRRLAEGGRFFSDLAAAPSGMSPREVEDLQGGFFRQMGIELAQARNQLAGFTDSLLEITLATEQQRKNTVAYGAAVGWSSETIAEALSQLDRASALARDRVVIGWMNQMLSPLRDNAQYAEEVARWKAKEVDLQYEIYKMNLQAAGLWDEARPLWEAARDAAKEVQSAVDIVAGFLERQAREAEQLANAQKAAADKFKDLVSNLVEATRRRLTGPESALTPKEQYELARADYEKTLGLAKLGDSKALADIVAVGDTFEATAKRYFAGGAGEGLLAGFGQIQKQLVMDFAGLALSPQVEKLALESLVKQELASLTGFADQTHQDLLGLRNTMLDLLAINKMGVLGGPSAFLSSAGQALTAPVMEGNASLLAEVQSLRQEVRDLRDQLASLSALGAIATNTGQTAANTGQTASNTRAMAEDTEVIARDAEDARLARNRGRAA